MNICTVSKQITLKDFVAFKKAVIDTKKYSTGASINEGVLNNFKSRLVSSTLLHVSFECNNEVYEIFNQQVK